MLACGQFEELALNLGETTFDIMLVADGSGTLCTEPYGWYCACYYRPTQKITEHCGGASGGSNNYAEIAPFVHSLGVFLAAWKKHNPTHGATGFMPNFDVLAVSDSELTCKIGNGEYVPTTNLQMWSALRWFTDNDFNIRWRHVPRNSNLLNATADRVAGNIRKYFKQNGPLA